MDYGHLSDLKEELQDLLDTETELLRQRLKTEREYQKCSKIIVEQSRVQWTLSKELEQLSRDETVCTEQKLYLINNIQHLHVSDHSKNNNGRHQVKPVTALFEPSTQERTIRATSSEKATSPIIIENDVSAGGDSLAQDIEKTLESILNEEDEGAAKHSEDKDLESIRETDAEEFYVDSFTKHGHLETNRNDFNQNSSGTMTTSATAETIYDFGTDMSIISTGSFLTTQDDTLLALKADTNFIYKSYSNKKVIRQNIKDKYDIVHYEEHSEVVKTMYVNNSRKLLYTGSKDGHLRCFELDTGKIVATLDVGESVEIITCGWKQYLIVSTVNSWIHIVNETLDKGKARYRMTTAQLAGICFATDNELGSILVVMPLGFNPTLINALNGRVITEFGEDEIQMPAFGVVEDDFFYLTTLKYCTTSITAIYNLSQKCTCVWRQVENGRVSQLDVQDRFVYMVLKQNDTYQLRCLHFSQDTLAIRWISYIGYFPITLLAPISPTNVLAGSRYGFVHHTAVDSEGPFSCTTPCNCNLYFARQSDLNIHLAKSLIK